VTLLAVVQRVWWAQAEVDGRSVGRIDQGLLVYVGVTTADTPAEAARLAGRIVNLRVFPGNEDKLNLSVQDVRGGILAVPNFTLVGDSGRGRRPNFTAAAPAKTAEAIFDAFVSALRQGDCNVSAGRFGAHMVIGSAADGPVNIIVEVPPRAENDPG